MNKKALSVMLSLGMACTLLSETALASPVYTDISGHWAAASIERWSNYNVVSGKGENVFDPDSNMTRAEAAKVFSNLLGLQAKADLSTFDDVGQGNWYDDAIAKCVAVGIMNGIGADKMNPSGTINREQFFTMYARALGIQEEKQMAKHFVDGDEIATWASGAFNALVNKGFVNGVSADRVAPKLEINRASVMALLDKSLTIYANTAGEKVKAEDNGIVLVVANNVTVTGAADTVVVAPNVAFVNLDGATVKNMVVNGKNTAVTVKNSDVEKVTVLSLIHI